MTTLVKSGECAISCLSFGYWSWQYEYSVSSKHSQICLYLTKKCERDVHFLFAMQTSKWVYVVDISAINSSAVSVGSSGHYNGLSPSMADRSQYIRKSHLMSLYLVMLLVQSYELHWSKLIFRILFMIYIFI